MINKVDVTIATKNSEETIEQCIKNIKEHIPYNNIILLDDSDDDTPKIAKKMGAIVYNAPKLLGQKRYLQAYYSETEWIASIDSDVYVYPNWWKLVSKEIKDKVGVINGFLESELTNSFPAYDKYTKYIAIKRREIRGKGSGIGNTLIRRNILLKLKKDLEGIHLGEDAIIGQRVKEMGLIWAIVKTPIGCHFRKDTLKHDLISFYNTGRFIVKNKGKIKGLFWIFPFFLDMLIHWISFSIYSKKFDFRLFRFLLSTNFRFAKGLISGIKEF